MACWEADQGARENEAQGRRGEWPCEKVEIARSKEQGREPCVGPISVNARNNEAIPELLCCAVLLSVQITDSQEMDGGVIRCGPSAFVSL
jgi:hypothetical protein